VDLIPTEIAPELYAYIAGICRSLESEALRVGGTENHVHIACTLPRTLTVSKLMEEIKKSSSIWIKGKHLQCRKFSWQTGYGVFSRVFSRVFSLGQSQLETLIHYIDTQKEHHSKHTFQDELLQLLCKYKVSYDEKYLWN